MGKGKGDPSHWVAVVKKGKILFEMDGVPIEMAKTSMRVAAFKIPLRTKFITRTHS
jgi:large subunit ribosomal protein L16